MNLATFQTKNSNSLLEFILFWSKRYSYANEIVYSNSISKKIFTHEDIQNLYVWKNGMKLSEKKQKSLDNKIIKKLEKINDFKKSEKVDLDLFCKEFKELTAVWKIFLLHLLKPNIYPIYDQHIHRTFLFIHSEDWTNISNDTISNINKEKFYFERYLPFIQTSTVCEIKKMDEAFFAFGQFLNTRNYATLLSKPELVSN